MLDTLWPPKTSRLYIDRIFWASSRFANWDPALPIKLGDYGKISKKSGEFRKKGNIFDHEATRECAFANFNETIGEEGSVEKYFSLRAKAADVHSGVKAGSLVGVQEKFEFNRGRAAILVMHKPTLMRLDGDLDRLKDHLRGLHLVTEITTCPDYFLYMSSEKSGKVELDLHISSVTELAGGEVGGGWSHQGIVGVYKEGTRRKFTPLFRCVKFSKDGTTYRNEEPSNTSPENYYQLSAPPWGSLDDEGEEELEDPDGGSNSGDEEQELEEGSARISPTDNGDVPVA